MEVVRCYIVCTNCKDLTTGSEWYGPYLRSLPSIVVFNQNTSYVVYATYGTFVHGTAFAVAGALALTGLTGVATGTAVA
jgi:hypothetical protein